MPLPGKKSMYLWKGEQLIGRDVGSSYSTLGETSVMLTVKFVRAVFVESKVIDLFHNFLQLRCTTYLIPSSLGSRTYLPYVLNTYYGLWWIGDTAHGFSSRVSDPVILQAPFRTIKQQTKTVDIMISKHSSLGFILIWIAVVVLGSIWCLFSEAVQCNELCDA